MLIRRARLVDSEGIRAIYNAEVTSTSTFDLVTRTADAQRSWLEEHSGAYPAVVADSSGKLVGFGSLSRYRDRAAYATTVEDSVYVDESSRGQGTGRLLLEELLRLATAHGFHTVIGRIVGGNDASVALHRHCGFELVGVETEVGRKLGRWLDVVVVQRVLSGPAAGPAL
ncbi:MAG: GNAT family N-acetyltransferase [Thermoplasmata archaeon]